MAPGTVDQIDPADDPVDARFEATTVAADADAPAGAEAADMDGDGDLDLVVNFFGTRSDDAGPTDFPPGGITIYRNDGGLDAWTAQPVLTPEDDDYFVNEASPVDLDADGDLDLLAAAGFFVCGFTDRVGPCGALFWLEQDGESWVRHDIAGPGLEYFYHRALLADLDGDDIDDLVTVAETDEDARAEWYRGVDRAERFSTTAEVIGQGGGSLPVLEDIDDDGDLDLASAEFFLPGGSFAWFEQVEAPTGDSPGEWRRHVIADDLGPSIELAAVPDLDGSGEVAWIGSNHVNTPRDPQPESGVYRLVPGDDPTEPWTTNKISGDIVSRPIEGVNFQAAPGVFSWGDVDDDGDLDLTVSGDGDPRVLWLEQTAPGAFEQHTLRHDFGQAASGAVEDLDGDGDHEVVFTSYDTGEVLIFDFQAA